MLTWAQEPDGWHADGLLIALAAPYRWELLEVADESEPHSAISFGSRPLATTRTLSAAKREAELVAADRQRKMLRSRHLGILAVTVGLGPIVLTDFTAQSFLILLVMVAVFVRALGTVVGTLFPVSWDASSRVMYQ